MSTMLQKRFSILLALGLLAAAGCQSGPTASKADAGVSQPAVLITTAHGQMVIMKTDDPNHPAVMTSGSMPVCETCKRDAIKSFDTGKIESTCPDCGATRKAIAMLPVPANNHQR